MPRVVALYRYPVKGGTPEACDTLTVLAEGRIAGDRALGFRFAGSGLPDTAWSKKHGYAALVNTPALARQALANALHCAEDWIGVATQLDGFAWRDLA